MNKNPFDVRITCGFIAKELEITAEAVSQWHLPGVKSGREKMVLIRDLIQHLRRKRGEGDIRDRDRREAAEADMAEMRRDEQAGTLVQVATVQAEWAGHIGNARARLLQLPSKVAVRMEEAMSVGEREAVVRELVHEALAELSGRGGAG